MRTLDNDTLSRSWDGGAPGDDKIDRDEFTGHVPNHEFDHDKLASHEDDGPTCLVDAMAVDYDEDEEAEEDGKYYGAHYELHSDYESHPSAEPEPEGDDDDDDAADARVAFLFGGVLPDPEPVDEDEGAIVAGPSATTDHDVHHWLKGDDVQYIPNVDQHSDSSSSASASGSGSDGSRSPSPERFDDVAEQAEREAEYQRRVAAALERPLSPTPDAGGIPHYASEDIDASFAFTLSLEHKSDDEILAALLGDGHGGVLTHLNPTPPPSPGPVSQSTSAVASGPCGRSANRPFPDHTAAHPTPAPAEHVVIRPELAKRLDEAKGPRNRLKRTFDGDAFLPDGAGGYMSARTGRHVERPFEADWVQRQELNTMRNLAERIDAGQVVVVVVQQAAQPTSPASEDDSVDHDIAAQQDAGDCSTSDVEVASSQQQQSAVNARTPRLKRTREEADVEGEDDDAALAEKRRRVRSEEQPGSPAALRLRSRARNTGPSTAATRSTIQLNTAAATAPHPENEGAAVVKTSRRAARRPNEVRPLS